MRLEKVISDAKTKQSAIESKLSGQHKRSTNEVNDLKVTLDATKGTLATREDKNHGV